MRIVSTTTVIALGFAFIISSAVLGAHFFGLLPDRSAVIANERLHLANLIASQCSAAADANDAEVIGATFASLGSSNPEVLSAGLRAPDGELLVESGPHSSLWHQSADGQSGPISGSQISIPIMQNNERWATVELYFTPAEDSGLLPPVLRTTIFVAASGFLGSLLFLKKVLKHLDPSSVIPDRVRTMLDALAEGVVIMDNSDQVVMANEAFCRIARTSMQKIQGRRLTDIPWIAPGDGGTGKAMPPWINSIKQGVSVRRETLLAEVAEGENRTLVINAVAIQGASGERRGILATFDDVTTIEAANTQLRAAMDELGKSRDEIARKNRELEVLAARDPLTTCLNRRSFLRAFEEAWAAARNAERPLACIMLDIDHFKLINDRYGHSAGDQVLKQLGQLLLSTARVQDITCRYGGEEFCLLLPDTAFDAAFGVAERLCQTIAAATWPITGMTVSLGVSGMEAGAADMRQLLDQADKALYAAKRTGRNRAIPWGHPAIDDASESSPAERRTGQSQAQIRQVVNALFEALRQRDASTAEHSQRVADLVSGMAPQMFDAEEAALLHNAALLHDVGKIAIPDAILRKPGPLTDEEWKLMHQHEYIGSQLVEQALGNSQLTGLIRLHQAWYAGTPHAPSLPTGTNIPKGCRLLSIVDAYDALVSDRYYRKATTPQLACQELRRCAGTQFDPELVEAFIAHVSRSTRFEAALNQLEQQYAAAKIEHLASAIQDIMSASDNQPPLPANPLPASPVATNS